MYRIILIATNINQKMGTKSYSNFVLFLMLAADPENSVDSIPSRDYYHDKHQEYL